MGLDSHRKNYIKKNLRNFSISKIARDIGASENEILDYLKKKWSPEKYEKFLRNQYAQNSDLGQGIASFSFMNFFRENWTALTFLAFLVFAVYANSLGNGFVSDDIAGFANNPDVGKFSRIFSGGMHFSLTAFFQFFTYHIGGLHPFSFRIINILFHLGSVILIYVLLSLSMKKRIAIIAASIFAVHPILTESVSWISGSPYAIYSFFFLLSFLFYLFSKDNKKHYYYSTVFLALSIFTTEKATVLFLIFVLYELAFGSIRDNWKRILPYLLISLVLLIFFVSKIGHRVAAVESQSYQSTGGMYNPFVQIPVAIGTYLKLIFWPAKLTLYQTEMAFTRPQFLFLVAIFLAFLGALALSWFKNKTIFFWLAFFPIALLPTLTPFKISWIVAERYAYLGTLGIIIVVAILADKFLGINENAKMVGYFALVIIVASLSVRTIIRNMDWKSEDTLWIATAKMAPSGQVIHNNLGDVYARQGDFKKSVEEFKKAIEINPNYADAYHNLGNTYQQMGQIDLALENYRKAASINTSLWQSYQNMAAIYFGQGNYERASENIKKALEINPGDPNLQQNLQIIQSKTQEQ